LAAVGGDSRTVQNDALSDARNTIVWAICVNFEFFRFGGHLYAEDEKT
jgi:hypothetical protein